MRIVWYLARYHAIKISDASVYRILKSNRLYRRPQGTRLRKVHTIRYQKQVCGHQIQIDVKFVTFKSKDDKPIKRYQYTAIGDVTRVRALKIYERYNQASAISFIDYVVAKFPFRISEVRTDNGHEFQAKFHWRVEDKGIRHAYIKPSSPQLNDEVERYHRIDEQEFYQLLTYKDDIELNAKLTEWRAFTTSQGHTALSMEEPLRNPQGEAITRHHICLVRAATLQAEKGLLQYTVTPFLSKSHQPLGFRSEGGIVEDK